MVNGGFRVFIASPGQGAIGAIPPVEEEKPPINGAIPPSVKGARGSASGSASARPGSGSADAGASAGANASARAGKGTSSWADNWVAPESCVCRVWHRALTWRARPPVTAGPGLIGGGGGGGC